MPEKVALAHKRFWNAFFVLSRQYLETKMGVIYISCTVSQYDPRKQVSYVLIISEFFNSTKYSVNDLCVQADLTQLFESQSENLVQRYRHQGRNYVIFSQKLRDIGIEPHLYPEQVALYKFSGSNKEHDVVVLIPTNNEDVSYLLTRMELRPDQDVDFSQIEVLSVDDVIPEEQVIFCLRELNHPFPDENTRT